MKKDENLVVPKECPICGITSNYIYFLTNKKEGESKWYRCTCGIIHQDIKPDHKVYDDMYIARLAEAKDSKLVYGHAAKTYTPIIEELTYGRKMFDVGFCLPHNMNFFRERGWIPTGIDVNDEFRGSHNVIIGSFEDMEQFPDHYNLIWMSHVLEHFNDPIKAMRKAFELLPEDGVLYISTPDIDFINKTGVEHFPHWRRQEHYILWSEEALKRELRRIGFKIVMSRRNFTSRYSSWYDIHCLAQKDYF